MGNLVQIITLKELYIHINNFINNRVKNNNILKKTTFSYKYFQSKINNRKKKYLIQNLLQKFFTIELTKK